MSREDFLSFRVTYYGRGGVSLHSEWNTLLYPFQPKPGWHRCFYWSKSERREKFIGVSNEVGQLANLFYARSGVMPRELQIEYAY